MISGLLRFHFSLHRLFQKKVRKGRGRRSNSKLSESLAFRGKFLAVISDQPAAPVLEYDVDCRRLQFPAEMPAKYKIISIHVVVDQLDRRETTFAEAAD